MSERRRSSDSALAVKTLSDSRKDALQSSGYPSGVMTTVNVYVLYVIEHSF